MPDVNPRSFTAGGMWNGVPMACHNATLFWLYEAEFSRQPSLNDYLNAFSTHPKNPTGIVREMLALGQRLSRPAAGNALLTTGAVIVFVHNGQPGIPVSPPPPARSAATTRSTGSPARAP